MSEPRAARDDGAFRLGEVELDGGARAEAIAIPAPAPRWADRLERLLGHKPPFWQWQCRTLLHERTDLDARFYALHRGGRPFAHVLIAATDGVGLLSHVFTTPAERRRGAARALLRLALADFGERGGRALFLRTDPGGAPFRLYEALGFRALEPGSGVMARNFATETNLPDAWFAPGETELRPPQWSDWPAAAALFTDADGGTVRCLGRGLVGRAMSEGPFLAMLKDHTERMAGGAPPATSVLAKTTPRAVVGVAHRSDEGPWPGLSTIDVHCHPAFVASAAALLAALPLSSARCVAHCDRGQTWKRTALAASGFEHVATLPEHAAADAVTRRWVDVEVWRRG